MAGHSQFKNIMYRKGAQDAKRAKMFTKIQREITAACKTGVPDAAVNPRLRSAIQWAREENMPRDKIESTVKRASGNAATDNFESMRYEGYGPGGVAVIALALTDNRNRTAADVRSFFNKFGGAMGETGSVSFMFDYHGRITYKQDAATEEQMFEVVTEAGADNYELKEQHHVITCAIEDFGSVRDALERSFGSPQSAKLTWTPKTTTSLNEEQAKILFKLIDSLEDLDDVQEVFANFEISEQVMEAISRDA